MPKYAEFFAVEGEKKVSRKFLLEYQRCILIALKREGLLSREQLEECILRLESQRL